MLDNLRKELAQGIALSKNRLDHIYQWKECPDGSLLTIKKYDQVMMDCGVAAEKAQDQLAGVKGQVSARLARQKAKA